MTGAVLRAQWLSMRLGRTAADRRAAVFSAVTATLWYGFWAAAAWTVFQYCAHTSRARLTESLRGGLLLAFVYWQAMPVVTASMGAGLDMRKLLVYPISHGRLFQLEALLRAAAGAEMLLAMAAGAAGLALNPEWGGWEAVPRLALSAILFSLFNVLLASGTRSLVERLLSRRGLREALALAALALLVAPRLVSDSGDRLRAIASLIESRRDGLPWTLAADAAAGGGALRALFGLCAWTAVAALFGRWQFERSLRYDAAAQAPVRPSADPRAAGWAEFFYAFPSRLLRDPLAAIVEKELRTLGRSPRFRMVFAMGIAFGLLVWLPAAAGGGGVLARHFLTVVSVYSLVLLGQVSFWNSFGFDRSAAFIYYATPASMTLVLVGKNVAALTFIYLEAALLGLVTAAFRLPLGAASLAESAIVLGISSLYMLGLGNVSSVQYPRGLSPERVSQGGASTRFQALIFLLYPLALLPVLLAYLTRFALASEAAFWGLMTVAGLIGTAVYWIGTESAAAAALRRREALLRDLARGDGPAASN